MMHPSRQAYVEEGPQVRNYSLPPLYTPLYLHMPSRLDSLCVETGSERQTRLTDMAETQDTEMGVDLANIRESSACMEVPLAL